MGEVIQFVPKGEGCYKCRRRGPVPALTIMGTQGMRILGTKVEIDHICICGEPLNCEALMGSAE